MNKFIPKNIKYKKTRKKLKFKVTSEKKHISLKLGSIGLKALESGFITANVLEAVRRVITRKIKKIGKLLIFIHPNISLSKKSVGTRMGKGAGAISSWIAPTKKGKILFELKNVPINIGILAFKSASFKIPFLTKIVYK